MEVDIKFEPSGQVGVIAVGTYLYDAAQRMGIKLEAACEPHGDCDSCAVQITKGRELLSELTATEMEVLNEAQRNSGMRLSCQAKIEKQGELVVMVAEKKQTEEEIEAERQRARRKEFEELPLEKKVASLVELEAIALSETISFVMNSPFMIFGKVMDIMAEFGLKMDTDEKKAKRPAEHETENTSSTEPKKRSKKGKATETVNEAP